MLSAQRFTRQVQVAERHPPPLAHAETGDEAAKVIGLASGLPGMDG